MNNLWNRNLTHWIQFRNPHNLLPVVVQSFMMLCAFLIVLGLVYVLLLVIAIAIHHILFDKDPKKVPDYVKRSVQFSSEEEDDGEQAAATAEDSDSDDANKNRKESIYASTARKLAKLDKFLNFDDKKAG